MNCTKLVSIISPCFNSENYIKNMLESILQQTYSNIELICINDGSTDNTEKIIKEYIPVYKKQNKVLKYVWKQHAGQAAAVNEGLKIMSGEYFGLLDSDDYLTVDSIEKKVNILEENLDYSVVASDYYIIDEGKTFPREQKGNDFVGNLCFQPYQFYLLIVGKSVVTPLGYMIRTRDFDKINPDRKIHECIEGQNYQLLLPLYYFYKRIYINEPLGYYLVREQSHGHKKRSEAEIKQRYNNLLSMLKDVLTNLNLPHSEIEKCIRLSSFNFFLENR